MQHHSYMQTLLLPRQWPWKRSKGRILICHCRCQLEGEPCWPDKYRRMSKLGIAIPAHQWWPTTHPMPAMTTGICLLPLNFCFHFDACLWLGYLHAWVGLFLVRWLQSHLPAASGHLLSHDGIASLHGPCLQDWDSWQYPHSKMQCKTLKKGDQFKP